MPTAISNIQMQTISQRWIMKNLSSYFQMMYEACDGERDEMKNFAISFAVNLTSNGRQEEGKWWNSFQSEEDKL